MELVWLKVASHDRDIGATNEVQVVNEKNSKLRFKQNAESAISVFNFTLSQ